MSNIERPQIAPWRKEAATVIQLDTVGDMFNQAIRKQKETRNWPISKGEASNLIKILAKVIGPKEKAASQDTPSAPAQTPAPVSTEPAPASATQAQ